MEAVGHLLCRIWLFFLLFWLGQGRRMAPPGFVESSCRSRIFWMKLNKLLLQGKFFQLEIYDPYSGPVLLDEDLASRCGYVLSEDVWGNPVFRASVLGCHVANEADELFSLTVNIKVSSFSSMRAAVTYTYPMYCSYTSWASREIVCEENYMEVSVKTDVPAVSNDYTVAWMSALPETQNVAYQQWQLVFVSPSGRKRITVSDAVKLGYSFNNTLSRVYLRAPYHSNESDVSVVSGVNMNMVTSTSMYRQRWLLLLIDTTVSCPVDGISFTDTTLTWTVPRVIPTLVVQESTFLSKSIVMGVDDQVIVNPEETNYSLEHNETHIRITIPIGAEGGKLESSISGGVYGVFYSIDLCLEHTWTDAGWQTTKYTVIKSITTPFMPQIPTVINNTVPEERLFNVAFGHFLPDVSLVAIAIGNVPFTLREAQHHGFSIYETPFSNGTKEFILEVSFDDPYVLKEYVNRNETKYTLLVNYTLSVGPEMTLYYHSAEVECVIADIEIPEAVGGCDEENLYLTLPTFGLHQYWDLYLGNKLLNRHLALTNGYLAATNSTHLTLQIPLFAGGVIYKEVSFQKIKARFDVALRKVRTMETLQMFSVSCSFNSSVFIICHPDGTIMISAQMKTVPAIDMSKTKLRDSSCKPREYNEAHAFFKFHVTTCGTSVRFEGDHIIYENEISYEKETLPGQSIPTITRDPDYRLTVLCYYQAKETLVLGAFSSDPATSSPFGSGTMVPQSNTAAYRRVRQALNVVSRVSKDESFTEFYEPSIAILKQPVEPVFLEVELKDESPSVELYLENCWVARSPDFNSTPRWNITADGCEISGSEFAAEFCPVPVSSRVRHPSHFKRLAVRTLAQQLEQVYVHCSVAACSPTNTQPGSPCRGQCRSSRERKAFPGHRSDSLQGYVLAGPVRIVAPDLR
ncbi:zona pellucida sperm-binding protein 2-like [Corvus cornix cornix]|uniref:zona pellucida sperm-binding protein 2-like n=1 Tax=Corvus cornix cornix TaxID=932674 RepID=UPI00195222C8|nr:zona pellucida sperm-binding protein 2-like [Corvus cornix cornix]XP_039423833.1 zona pellucida sperm-binding protein 2-like [Corvus cornix cornix]